MDGLLVDLFNTISHKLYKKEYKSLSKDEKDQARIIWTDHDEFFKHFGSVKGFFANLESFNNNRSNRIVNTVVEFTKANPDLFEEGYCICSHPASIDSKGSEEGKRIWIKKTLMVQPNEEFYPDKKSRYAKNGDISNILIDDFLPYIQAWRDAGGIAIEMRTDSVEDVEGYLYIRLNEAKKQLSTKFETFNYTVNSVLKQLI